MADLPVYSVVSQRKYKTSVLKPKWAWSWQGNTTANEIARRFPVARLPLVNSVLRSARQFVALSMSSRSQSCAERKREKELVWLSVRVHVPGYFWKLKVLFLRLRHSVTKNAGFPKTVHRVEFFLANVGLLETLVSLRNGTAGRRGCKMLVCDKRGRAILTCFVVIFSLKESEVWRKVI